MATADEPTPTRLRGTPSWLLTQSAEHARRIITEAFGAAGARGYHYRLLLALEEFGPDSQATLGRHTGIDRSDVVAALNELAEQGYIDRVPDPADRRRNVISLTTAGRRQLRRLDKLVAEAQDRLLEPLSETDRARLAKLLGRLLDHHDAG